MPCNSGYEFGGLHRSTSAEINLLRTRYEKITKILCYVDKELSIKNPVLWNETIQKNSDLISWISNHRTVDHNRWSEYYKNIYPNFSKEEIIKMVINKVLKEV